MRRIADPTWRFMVWGVLGGASIGFLLTTLSATPGFIVSVESALKYKIPSGVSYQIQIFLLAEFLAIMIGAVLGGAVSVVEWGLARLFFRSSDRTRILVANFNLVMSATVAFLTVLPIAKELYSATWFQPPAVAGILSGLSAGYFSWIGQTRGRLDTQEVPDH